MTILIFRLLTGQWVLKSVEVSTGPTQALFVRTLNCWILAIMSSASFDHNRQIGVSKDRDWRWRQESIYSDDAIVLTVFCSYRSSYGGRSSGPFVWNTSGIWGCHGDRIVWEAQRQLRSWLNLDRQQLVFALFYLAKKFLIRCFYHRKWRGCLLRQRRSRERRWHQHTIRPRVLREIS